MPLLCILRRASVHSVQAHRLLPLIAICVLSAGCAPPPVAQTPTLDPPLTPTATLAPLPTASPTVGATPIAVATAYVAEGELRLAVREDIKTLNPFTASSASERLLVSLVYDTLLDADFPAAPQPNLAQRWDLFPQGLSLTFWIDPRARWHDGRSVSADDVVYSFNLAREHNLPGWVSLTALVDRVEARSSNEVHFALLSAQSDILHQLGMRLPIVPAHAWEAVVDPLNHHNWEHPVGSGPFRVLEQAESQRIVLASTTAHPRNPPRIDRLVIEIIRDDERALRELQQGQLDLLAWDVSVQMADEIQSNPQDYPGVSVLTTPGATTHTVMLNLRRAPCNSLPFRQALTLATDVDTLIEELLGGFAQPAAPSLFAAASPWRLSSLTPVSFDPQLAIARLDALGLSDSDRDGTREAPDGQALQVSLYCEDVAASQRVAALVAEGWRSVGVAVTVTAVAQDAVLPLLASADFEAILHQVDIGSPTQALALFHSSRGSVNGGLVFGDNHGGYSSDTCDQILSDLLEEHDSGRQAELYARLQHALATDMPQVPLYCPQVLNLYRDDRFTDWSPIPGLGLASRSTLTSVTMR